MQDLKVTLVQANQIWEDKSANLNNYSHLLEGVDTDLIILPEMFQTGFSMQVEKLGESMEGESVQWLKDCAKKNAAAIYTSLIVKENNSYYNRGLFVFPDGTINIYDKRKSFGLANETEHYTPGNNESIVDYKGWKFQLQICYDLRFPEIVRNGIDSNQSPKYDVILYVANWPEKRSSHWNALLNARAIENQCYVIGVNRVGSDANGLTYSGNSKMINALGSEHEIEPYKETVETFVMHKDELNETRKKLPFLKDAI
jgi:predicted amidohydrolase